MSMLKAEVSMGKIDVNISEELIVDLLKTFQELSRFKNEQQFLVSKSVQGQIRQTNQLNQNNSNSIYILVIDNITFNH